MISLSQYVGIHAESPDWMTDCKVRAIDLLDRVNKLQDEMLQDGVFWAINPKTKSNISGETFGGFRPQSCPIGAANSAHKTGQAVDIFDPDEKLDLWCMANQSKLKDLGLCLESPKQTKTWCHLQSRPVPSGRVVFVP